MYAAIFTMGVGVGGVITLQETVWADYFGRLTLGAVRSVGRPFTIVFSAGGPVLAALAYDLRQSYEVAFLVFIASYLLAAVMILLTPTPRPPATSTAQPSPPMPLVPAVVPVAPLASLASVSSSPLPAAGDLPVQGSGPGVAWRRPAPRDYMRPREPARPRDYMQREPGSEQR
jgi:hypothetical protein